uniref:Uncharacterized protein n=1 Tax=Picea glauca TaxID=3330 RepID=A0A101LXK6_PICGL|nr:hypothetical protein ABT39_MTgene6176 [Picea glauca]
MNCAREVVLTALGISHSNRNTTMRKQARLKGEDAPGRARP